MNIKDSLTYDLTWSWFHSKLRTKLSVFRKHDFSFFCFIYFGEKQTEKTKSRGISPPNIWIEKEMRVLYCIAISIFRANWHWHWYGVYHTLCRKMENTIASALSIVTGNSTCRINRIYSYFSSPKQSYCKTAFHERTRSGGGGGGGGYNECVVPWTMFHKYWGEKLLMSSIFNIAYCVIQPGILYTATLLKL